MSELMIAARDLSKNYDSGGETAPALRGIDFTVEKGEILAVMGHSGSGKSTLLSIIGALTPPSNGRILIDGIDVYGLPQERRADFRREYLGFVFQHFQLIPYLTALENILLPLTITSYGKKEKLAKATGVLEQVGLANKGRRLPSQLSGGEQERVAVARAIVNDPPLILADEPTGSLDTRTGEEIMELFKNLNATGLTVLIVTHNPENRKYVDRVITLQDGKITGGGR